VSTALEFVDCSSNNPLPNLHVYKAAGHRAIMRKVSEGSGYHWYEGDALADQAHVLGLDVGHYHWLRPDQHPLDQANFFVAKVRDHLCVGDFLVTDFESTVNIHDPDDHVRAAQLRIFNHAVDSQLPGYPLYVYTGNWYLDGKPQCQAEVRRWPVFMSNYSDTARTLPNPHDLHYAAWQFTDRARVAGFSAPVDLNRWLIDPHVTKEFTVDAKAQAEFDALKAQVAGIYDCFKGSDGHHHTVESAVAHVTQGNNYLSKKGHVWARLFRRREARPSIVVPAAPPEIKK
jgi:GH25 family lysozyme M1 (1,4-beta-N-acetylmuramidase)